MRAFFPAWPGKQSRVISPNSIGGFTPFTLHRGLQEIHLAVLFSCSVISDSVTPWTAAYQVSLSFTISWNLLRLMSIELVMPSNHLILCGPLLLLPSFFLSIRVFSNESVLHIRWPKYWSFSFSISPTNEHPGLISLGWTGWISLQSKGLSRVFSNTTVQKHQFFCTMMRVLPRVQRMRERLQEQP